MGDRRVSGWFVLSAVFIIAVFGLFFTFTERKTWPEQRIELSAMDMRLVPPASTLWCEAVALYSEHPFVAYQISHGAQVSTKRLNAQKVNLQLKLGASKSSNSLKLKYFLLQSSIVEIFACASATGARLIVFKGESDIQDCLQSLLNSADKSVSSDDDSDEDSSEELSNTIGIDFHKLYSLAPNLVSLKNWKNKKCSSLVNYRSIDVAYDDSFSLECAPSVELNPVKMNITSSDYYYIVILNTNRQSTNHIDLQLLLDRARYSVHKSGQAFDMCSLSTTCTIGLGFASGDRVLVSIPDEPNAGRSSFVIRSRCKPRLAVFALLSVFLPLLIFLVLAFVVRADRDRIRRLYNCGSRADGRSLPSSQQRFATPLLDDGLTSSDDRLRLPDEENVSPSAERNDELPPPYHSLYDPPPPYACIKEGQK